MSTIKTLNHICPVCNSKEGLIIGKLKYTLFDNSPINSMFDVTCCTECGFIFCDTSSSQKNYNKFYVESFYSSDYINKKPTSDDNIYVEETLDILSPYLKSKDISIFDIGCGRGLLLEKLYKLGYKNLYGVDPSQSCINTLSTNTSKFKIEKGNILDIPFNDSKADIIILSHVLEHIIDLKKALKKLNDKLSDDGILYVEVPNATNYDMFTESPLRYFYLQHVSHFDDFHLNNLFICNKYMELKRGHRIRKEGKLQMHSIWGIYCKSKAIKINPNPSFRLSCQIRRWFDSTSLDNDNILTNLASSNTQTYLWGLGTHAQLMLSMSPLKNCNIKNFIDNDEKNQKKTIKNQKIYSTDKLYNASEQDAVVICAPTHSQEMYKHLTEEIGFKGKTIIIEFDKVSLC